MPDYIVTAVISYPVHSDHANDALGTLGSIVKVKLAGTLVKAVAVISTGDKIALTAKLIGGNIMVKKKESAKKKRRRKERSERMKVEHFTGEEMAIKQVIAEKQPW